MCKGLAQKSLNLLMMFAVLFYSFGGADFFLGFSTPYKAQQVDAAYSAKHLRTVEYTLGEGTENVTRATGILSYFGSATSTTKAGAGTKSVVLAGTNITVKNAYLDVSYVVTAAANVTNEAVSLDVAGSSSGGTMATATQELSTIAYANSGLSGYQRRVHDVTSFFDRQSDAAWATGVGVVAGLIVTGPTRMLTTIKLVITYESDYSLIAHTETKTVRFPLSSVTAGDRGTKSAQCAAAATCSFRATSSIADLAANADILDAYVELHGEVDSGTASTFRIGIRGGSGANASSSLYAWTEAVVDDTVENAIWRPNIGSPNFTPNTTQIYDVQMGTVAMNALGGELVITYRYSTGSLSPQTETVRYLMGQQATGTPITKTAFVTITPTISNGTMVMKSIWLKVHAAATSTTNLTLFGKVGTSTEVSSAIAISGVQVRSGDDHTIIFDLSDQAGNFWNSTTTIAASSQFSVSGVPVGAEVYFTFTWAGNLGGQQTQSVIFPAAQQGTNAVANQLNSAPVYIDLPETVTKTYRSAYIETKFMHSQAVNITPGFLTIGAGASTTVIGEAGGEATNEAYTSTYFTPVASSTFSNGDTINWTERVLEVNETKSVANTAGFTNWVVVTYDSDFTQTQPTVNPKHLRTVEYTLGEGTENVTRATGILSYFGSATSTTKAGAGTKSVVLAGTNITVKNAYLDVSYVVTAAANVTNEAVSLDVAGSSSGGTMATATQELSTIAYANSGLSGYQRRVHDVTSFFDRQSDAAWATGVGVVAGLIVTGPTRMLTTIKLVITYESDYSLIAHTETKTVRFPLSSVTAGDRGTKSAQCAAAATCSFRATSSIADLAANADILDAYVELHGEVDSGTASTFRIGIRGGSGANASSSLYAWTEAVVDDTVENAIWRPNIGSPNFTPNTTQIYDVQMGTVAMNALGGELVITYRYSTGSLSPQTETVRYLMGQQATGTPITKTAFVTITPTISNGTMVMKSIWLKVHAAATSTTNLTLFGKVGTSTEVSSAIAISGVQVRSGDDHTIIFDLSDQAGNFWNSTTTIAASSQFSVSGVPVGAEVYFTFTWAGNLGGQQTQSVIFPAAQQGTNAVANQLNSAPVYIDLPETVTKTYRSAYIETKFMHSQAVNITPGFLTIGAGASTTVIGEAGGEATNEAYTSTYFTPVASSTFSNGDTINWTERVLEVNETKSVANTAGFTNWVVVTYDSAQLYKFPTFTQNVYRFYIDNRALKPTNAWPQGTGGTLGEGSEITAADSPPGNGTNTRIRMSLTVATTTMLASSTQFKLQYGQKFSTCGAASWVDVGAPNSGVIWRGSSTPVVDGTNLSTNPPTVGDLLLSVSSRAGLYTSSNSTILNPFATAVGEDVEYDWNIQNNGAATDTQYCFRMTKSDGTVFNNYSSSYPTLRTAGYTAESKNWRWYDDEYNETPILPLAIENTAPSNVVNTNLLKLRLTLNETQGADGVNQKFMLQYSEWSDFSRGVYDLTSTTTCTINSIWCYGNGIDTDDQAISTLLLSDSAQKGRHNEAATTTSTSHPVASTATEYEFTIKHAGARVNTTYYFRVYDVNHARPVPLASGKSYPSLSTQGATVSFGITGIASSTVIAGVTTDVDTTPTSVPFNRVSISSSGVKAAYNLSISTDATEGYQVFMIANSDLINSFGTIIPPVTGTNATPNTWVSVCSSGATGCYGYHTTDSTLSGGSTRFLLNDTYAQFSTTTLDEVMYNSGPVTNDSSDIIFRVEAHAGQAGGGYTTAVQYIVVPIF